MRIRLPLEGGVYSLQGPIGPSNAYLHGLYSGQIGRFCRT